MPFLELMTKSGISQGDGISYGDKIFYKRGPFDKEIEITKEQAQQIHKESRNKIITDKFLKEIGAT